MSSNPFLGVVFHWLGGLASGSFYVPYRGVKKWSWETYWIVGGFFGWIVCPWLFAGLLTRDLLGVLGQQPWSTLWWTYFFGAMWGLGALTFGLTMRYLGMSLGMGIALGYCAAFGTLLPPAFKEILPNIPVAESIVEVASTDAGQVTLGGVAVCLLGIGIVTLAGFAKEREMPAAKKKENIAEFNFKKGIAMATFSGVMSACFAFALTAGNPIAESSRLAGTGPIWTGLPKLVIVVLGGFTTNVIWCVLLNFKNRSGYQYLASHVRAAPLGRSSVDDIASDNMGDDWKSRYQTRAEMKIPVLRNYLLSALAGTTWYLQFFFYTMGETKMGEFGFASWTMHMASIIIFSTLWGWILHEWKGASQKSHVLIALGIVTLVVSTIIIGGGTYLKAAANPVGH